MSVLWALTLAGNAVAAISAIAARGVRNFNMAQPRA